MNVEIPRLAVKETTAAKMLDLPASEFRRLVGAGALPPPIMIGPNARWRTAQIRCIAKGVAPFWSDYFETEQEVNWNVLDYLTSPDPSYSDSGRYIPKAIRNKVFERDGRKCVYCGDTEGPFHIDHVFPYSKGGTHELDNLSVACAPCNRSKRDKSLEEWRRH